MLKVTTKPADVPFLVQRSVEVDKIDRDVFDAVRLMMHEADNDGWVGVAANEVGLMKRVLILQRPWEGFGAFHTYQPMVNPIIKGATPVMVKSPERCGSIPRMTFVVMRHYGVKVEYTSLDGEQGHETLYGWRAAIFQHEYDHLDGILVSTKGTQGVLTA